MNKLGICYFIEEGLLEIYSNEIPNIILSINIRLSKARIKKLMENDNVYIYLNTIFKSPLDIKEVNQFA